MSKGICGIFPTTKGVTSNTKNPINKIDYNIAESIDVGKVDKVNKTTNHGITIKGEPNSVNQKYNDRGTLISERYYDKNGNSYLDIDYTNHGNQKTHPIVPHQHHITIIGNNKVRDKGVKIRK